MAHEITKFRVWKATTSVSLILSCVTEMSGVSTRGD